MDSGLCLDRRVSAIRDRSVPISARRLGESVGCAGFNKVRHRTWPSRPSRMSGFAQQPARTRLDRLDFCAKQRPVDAFDDAPACGDELDLTEARRRLFNMNLHKCPVGPPLKSRANRSPIRIKRLTGDGAMLAPNKPLRFSLDRHHRPSRRARCIPWVIGRDR